MLMKQFSNPMFMQAITEFQNNPTQAGDKYRDNPEVMTFLKEFCSIMGELSSFKLFIMSKKKLGPKINFII